MSRSITAAAVAASALAAGACAVQRSDSTVRRDAPAAAAGRAPVPAPNGVAVLAPAGYRVEAVLTDLQYPSSVEVDPAGNLYVAEAGAVRGDPVAPARVLRVDPHGSIEVVVDGLRGPVTDLLEYGGRLFISHRGVISVLERDGRLRDLVTGLPSLGDHVNSQLTVGPDGKLYFGQGTATNSGVVGIDALRLGWLPRHPGVHDRLPYPTTLAGETWTTIDPFRLAGGDDPATATTGAFAPFGQEREAVAPSVKANGAILRMNPDGSDLEVYAWGLRDPFGVQWGPDGALYVAENGFEERGSRPIANDLDDLYVIERGAWYGWPDYGSGVPVTDPRFRPAEGPAPTLLLEDAPPVEQPLMSFPARSGLAKLAFDRAGTFGPRGALYMAQQGPLTPRVGPLAAGAADAPGEPRAGVLRIDVAARTAEVFLQADASAGSPSPGLRRPLDVVFSDDGRALYIADRGVAQPRPRPATGVVWRVVPAGLQVAPPAGLSARPGGGRPAPRSGSAAGSQRSGPAR